MLIEQPPALLRRLYPEALWRMDPHEKAVYLTFDDGPIPGVTPWVLRILRQRGIHATFFMVGDNVCKHPREFELVREAGHRLGNHTFNHIKGFGLDENTYLANAERANEALRTNLFRPPHGHMTWPQYRLLKQHYHIVMWDLVTRDYSRRLNGEEVLGKVKRYTRNGSIITFHDSLKSEQNLQYALPRALDWLQEQGYAFRTFP